MGEPGARLTGCEHVLSPWCVCVAMCVHGCKALVSICVHVCLHMCAHMLMHVDVSMCLCLSPVEMGTDPVCIGGMWISATVVGAHHLQ